MQTIGNHSNYKDINKLLRKKNKRTQTGGDIALLIEYLPSTHKALVCSPVSHKASTDVHNLRSSQ